MENRGLRVRTTTATPVQWPFAQYYPGEPVPEK